MTCCSANNCRNRTEQGFRMYRFPSQNQKRYFKWVQNMRRGGNWKPSATSRLCEKHFEQSQFESRRQDGLIKLKPNAIPTLFQLVIPSSLNDGPLPQKSVSKNLPQKHQVTARKLATKVCTTETRQSTFVLQNTGICECCSKKIQDARKFRRASTKESKFINDYRRKDSNKATLQNCNICISCQKSILKFHSALKLLANFEENNTTNVNNGNTITTYEEFICKNEEVDIKVEYDGSETVE